MSESNTSSTGDHLRAMRLARGLSQEDVARALDISLKTVGRLEREGRGHNLRRVRNFLENLSSAGNDSSATTPSIPTFIEQQSMPGGPALAAAFHELAVLLDQLPVDQRAPAVQTFVDVQRQLDDGVIDPMKTLEAAAEVTVKAFSQFRRR